MKNFLETLTANLLNADWLNFLALIITVIVSLIISSGERLFGYSRERHEKLIAPLFILLEPKLYKKYDKVLVEQAMNIIDENICFADGALLNIRAGCRKHPEETFTELCHYIDNAYDHSCRKLKLKTRTLLYRINERQYKSKSSLVFHILLLGLQHMILVIGFLLITIYAIAIAASIAMSPFNIAPWGIQLSVTILIFISVFIVIRRF